MSLMPLEFRLAAAPEYPRIEEMVIESFEPIMWFKKVDARVGPLNGRDWRTRWHARMRHVFETAIVLVGESGGETVAMSSGTLDRDDAVAYIDLLAVEPAVPGPRSRSGDVERHDTAHEGSRCAVRAPGLPHRQ